MTYEEIKAEVERWPIAEQLRLLEDVSRTVRKNLEPSVAARNGVHDVEDEWRQEFEAERTRLLKDVPADSWLHQILGIARTREKVPMTREEDRQAILEYLTEKYGC